MALANLGINIRYNRLRRLLKVRDNVGASFYNLQLLRELKEAVSVTIDDGNMEMLEEYLDQEHPVIVAVDTIDLPYWNQESVSHAVVVVGLEEATVSLHDPWFEDAPKVVDRMLFESAWLRHEYAYAVIQKPG